MQIFFQKNSTPQKHAVLVVPYFHGTKIQKFHFWNQLSPTDRQYITSALPKNWSAQYKTCEHLFLPDAAFTLILVGLGEKSAWSQRKCITITRFIVKTLHRLHLNHAQLITDDIFIFPGTVGHKIEIIVQNLIMANYGFYKYKTEPKEGWPSLDTCTLIGKSVTITDAKRAVEIGQIIGENINITRDLSNETASLMSPEYLAREVEKLAKGTDVMTKILTDDDMARLNMNGVLAVGGGSARKPRFIILEYWGAGKKKAPFVFVGKGITFDSGGLYVKPPAADMEKMHLDMSGGAAVVGSMLAIAALKLRVNIVGLVPAAENMISGESYRPGDIVKMMSGKTVGIAHTDAEGRVILADALTYAERYKPACVLDVATLTGGAMIALGLRASALFTREQKLADELLKLGELSGDYLWQLPLWEEYMEEVKGETADILNLGKTRFGQAIHGAIFLSYFAEKYPWAHIDIAPRTDVITDDHLSPQAAGEGVRLLLAFARKRSGQM